MAESGHSGRIATFATMGGFGAILLWSATVGISHSLSKSLGTFGAAAAIFSIAGAIALARLAFSRQRRLGCRQMPAIYLFGCGLLFVIDMLCLYLAIGWAKSDGQLLEVGLINYLWPILTLLGSLFFLGKKAGIFILPGTLLALAGLFLVLNHGPEISLLSLVKNLSSNPPAFFMALGAAVFWAFYSNLARRWGGEKGSGGVDLFLPVTAIVMLLFSLFANEQRVWTDKTFAEAVFLGTGTYVAYGLWDKAMRAGNVVLVAAASYLIPLFSTIISSLYMTINTTSELWAGCGMLIAGSVISWLSVSDRRPSPLPQTPGDSLS